MPPNRKPTMCERRQRLMRQLLDAISQENWTAVKGAIADAQNEPGLRSMALELTCPYRQTKGLWPGLSYFTKKPDRAYISDEPLEPPGQRPYIWPGRGPRIGTP